MHPFLEPIVNEFRNSRIEQNKLQMEAYMKGQFVFLGLKRPDRNAIQKKYISAKQLPSIDDLVIIARELWELQEREFQYLAMDIIGKFSRQLNSEHIPLIEELITNKSWWDTVDYLASNSMGTILKKYPEARKTRVDGWIKSKNMWLNRTAILFQLKYKTDTDLDYLERAITPHIESKEFFLRKAIGWALRDYSKSNPDYVKNFVSSHPKLSGLSQREALRCIS